MKTKVLLTTTLFILITGGFANVDLSNQNLSEVTNHFELTEEVVESELIVKGVLYEGEVVPYVELQEVHINGNRNPEHFTKAKMIDGEIVSSIDLEEITIRPNL